MGWTFTHRGSEVSDMEFYANRLRPHVIRELYNHRAMNAIYMAVECADGDDKGKIFGLVALWKTEAGRLNYGFKMLEEGNGPVASTCPLHILTMLSPVDELYPPGSFGRKAATAWRDKCRQRAEGPAATQKNLKSA